MKKYLQTTYVIPALIPLILIILAPAVYTLYMSFHSISFGIPSEFVGFTNFINLFTDPHFWQTLLNNVLFVFIVVFGQIVLGLGIALLMAKGFPYQKFFISVIMMPYAVSTVIAVLIWRYMLQTDVGIINYLLTLIGAGQINWATNPLNAWLVIIAIEVWVRLPFSFLVLYSALLGVPEELYEAAKVDGAVGFQLFRHITFPVIKPAILVALIFRFIFGFRAFAVPWILTKGGITGETELLSTYMYRQAFSFWEFGAGSATAIIMTLVTFMIAIYYMYLMYQENFKNL